MSRLRILVLAPDANPESVSIALEGYSHSEALAKLHAVTLVTRSSNEAALRRVEAPFHAIEAISIPWLDRIYAWGVHRIFADNYHSRALTPLFYPNSLAFEWAAWLQLRTRIMAGEFDIVLRLNPTNPVLPSAFPFLLRNCGVPVVIGPINGGLPWPQGFSQAANQRSWIDCLRGLYRFMPFARSGYRRAAAIIAGSSHTYGSSPPTGISFFFIAENGVNSSLCSYAERASGNEGKLKLIYLGALVHFKACDLALRGTATLLRSGLAYFNIVGDGPDRARLEQLARLLGIEEFVSFRGMLPHAEAMQHLRSADVMVYPSVREFGGAVVVEALAAGAVPIVADFGGPGDTVRSDVGFKISLTSEEDIVSRMEKYLGALAKDRGLLDRLRQQGMSYVRDCLTWDAKAQDTTQVLNWVLRRGPKPELVPPKMLAAHARSVALPAQP